MEAAPGGGPGDQTGQQRAEEAARKQSQTVKREELFRITSECKHDEKRRMARQRLFAMGILSLGLALTLILTTVSIRVTYVTDSNGASQLLLTSESDPTRLMNLSGIEAAEGDRVYYTAFGGSLATLNIERAFTVNIEADGQEIPVKMVYGTVAEALEKAGITLGPDDYTEPALDSLVSIGSKIEVHRVRYEETVEYQTIPYETEYVYTSLYFRDTDRVTTLQAGSNGQCAITTRHRWVDGELENSIVTDVTTTVEPQDALIKAYGAGAPVSPLTGPDGTTNPPSSYSKVLTGKATGYYSRTGSGASGLGLGYGTVAVDPDVIPYGTLLYITSTDGKFVYGYAVATDTGIALQDGHILVDLFYETYAESVINGAINVNVYVVG